MDTKWDLGENQKGGQQTESLTVERVSPKTVCRLRRVKEEREMHGLSGDAAQMRVRSMAASKNANGHIHNAVEWRDI